MSIEDLADMEVADALDRQSRDEEMKKQREEEDPDDYEVLERERYQQSSKDDWRDVNPAGSGNTKRMWWIYNNSLINQTT